MEITRKGAGLARILVSAVLLTALSGGVAACHEAPDTKPSANASATPSGDPGQNDPCGAGKASKFLNREASPAIISAVGQSVGHERIRWIRPGEAVTQDYVSQRLNIIVGQDNRIQTLRCG